MKYYNAESIFPEELLKQVLMYVPEGLVYFAAPGRKRKRWGEMTGERKRIDERNHNIRMSYRQGISTVLELADAYGLSVDSIKRIIYRQSP